MTEPVMDYASPSPPAPEGRQNVGGSARRGFLWLMLQTLLGKIVSSIATFVAAWFLLPDDYKLVALAFPITQFISVMQQMGVDKVLIARNDSFDHLCNAGFWLSTTAGIASALLIVAAAPAAAWALHQPALLPMLLLLAIAAPFNGVTTMHQAWLQYHFRFRLIALMGIGGLLIQGGLTMLLAWMRWGPYSLIIPVMSNGCFRFIICWATVRLPLRWNPEIKLWYSILKDSFGAIGTQFFQLVVAQGDFLLLGFLWPPDSKMLGYFAFAFNLSTVVITSLVVNLATVLFPALSTMANDPVRQTEVFVRASRRLAIIGVPLCMLQGAAAAPLLHAIYGHKWDEAIVPLQILSTCMAIRVVCVANYALYFAQGRFVFQFYLSLLYACLFLVVVAVGSRFYSATAVAWAESLYFVLFDNLNYYLAIRHGKGTLLDVVRLYRVPLLATLVSVGAALAISMSVTTHPVLQIAIILAVAFPSYASLIWVFDKPSFDETAALVSRVLPIWPFKGALQS